MRQKRRKLSSSVNCVRTPLNFMTPVSFPPLCCRPSSGLMRLQTEAAQSSHNPFVPCVKAKLRNRASTSKMVWADQPRRTSILAKLVRFCERFPESPAPFKPSWSTTMEEKVRCCLKEWNPKDLKEKAQPLPVWTFNRSKAHRGTAASFWLLMIRSFVLLQIQSAWKQVSPTDLQSSRELQRVCLVPEIPNL